MEFAHKKEVFDSTSAAPLEDPGKSMKGYWAKLNAESIDGLPGIREAFKSPINFERSEKDYRKDVKPGTLPPPRVVWRTHWPMWDVKVLLSFIMGVVLSSLYLRMVYL
jgi:hypothetical protein